MTAEREETKYLVRARAVGDASPRSCRADCRRTASRARARTGCPDAHHYVTTIYFDTPSRTLFRAAASTLDHNVKMRAKEYYDLHPSLAEVATDPAQIVRYQPWLWFEIKRRDGTRTLKQRFRLPKRDVAQFFAEGRVTPDALTLAEAARARACATSLETCRALGEPLSASASSTTAGCPGSRTKAELRVTFDRGLASFAPPADLWARRQALVRSALGAPAAQEPSGVLEIKRRGAMPAWLGELLARVGAAPVPFSKFVTAARAVEAHG